MYIKLHSGFLFTVYMSKGSKDYIMYTIDTFNAMLKGSKDYVMYKRLCYLHNIDTLNAMLKGWEDYVMYTIWIHLKLCQRVERLCYAHNIDTLNAMWKGWEDYVMLKKGTYTFLPITFLIFNQFSI